MRIRLRNVLPLSLLAIIFIPMIVTSSEPTPPPGYCYGASGLVVSASGGHVVDIAVVLLGRGGDLPSEWIRLDDFGDGVDLTNDKGRFRVSACHWFKLDSLSVAAVLPDTLILSAPIRTADLYETVNEVPFTEEGFFCDDTEFRVENYSYGADSVIVPVR